MPYDTGQRIQNETRFGRICLFMMSVPQRVLLHANQHAPLHSHCQSQ